MTPGAHLLIGWGVATRAALQVRERRLVALAGVVPDIDGLGVIIDIASGGRTTLYDAYHHVLGHTLLSGVLLSLGVALAARTRRGFCFLGALAAFHLHLLGDLVGSGGPDGYDWPIPYLLPFSRHGEWAWQGQWLLNGWQNGLILLGLLVWAILHGRRNGYSFVQAISPRLDAELFRALGRRGWV